jgi:hypothetical protein
LPEEIALLFSKQETAPDLKKEMLNKKRNTEEHNFRKILQRKATFWSILPEDMQSRMSIIYGKRKNCFPLAINYAYLRKKGERKKNLVL